MKIHVAIIFFFMMISNSYGKLLNGYSSQIADYYKSLEALTSLLADNNLSDSQKRNIKRMLDDLTNFISYHDLTDQLLLQLETISPELFMEANNLKNLQGRETNIYVKLIDKERAGVSLMGATYFSPHPTDVHAPVSAYGECSVSIEIWLVNNSLKILYHELGHVSYLVPNLATYTNFYQRHYSGPDPNFFGHHGHDNSGKVARTYEIRYAKDYSRYLKSGGNRFDSILVQFERLYVIQKNSLTSYLSDRLVKNRSKQFNN